jgi:hypothetical protein
MGDYHVRFCERLRGETPLCLLGAFVAIIIRKFSGGPITAEPSGALLNRNLFYRSALTDQ